jgi:biotin carboxylase
VNLLVTNTRNAQAYAVIRALRPYARKIVATMEGENRLAARLSHAANSRLVDKRCYTPSPAQDWRAGKIQRENTEREESYIRAVEMICKEEKIDTIFPSFDPHVYVFSKNKERFERMGVLIPVPDYEAVIIPLDKYRTIRAAQEVGFPCPKTYLPESEDDLRRISEEIGFPLVIKPRFSAGARGMGIVSDFPELSQKTRLVREKQGTPMIQEYIPGSEKQQFYLTLDKKGGLKMAFCPKTHRLFLRLYRNSSAASESFFPHPYIMSAARIGQKVGWWGGITVQTKIDPRDGLPKLMEMNPRLGHHLWYRTALGINEPLMCLKIARGEEIESVKKYPVGKMLLSPVEDFLGLGFWLLDRMLYKLRTGWLGSNPLDSLNPPMSLKEVYQSYSRTYLNGNEKVFDPYFKYFSQDPAVSILWWLKYSYQVLAATKHLGR